MEVLIVFQKKSVQLSQSLSILTAFSLMALLNSPAFAQVALSLKTPDGQQIDITGKDRVRSDNSLILYSPDFGDSTRTNAYGVEVQAVREKGILNRYKVTQRTNVWDCDKSSGKLLCGNLEIPANGLVLSASGDRRDALMKNLPVGQVFDLQESWFQTQPFPLSIINPTPQNNPLASAFPGYRASNQMIIYNADYGQPKTGTNEFGYEVTVVNGIVVNQEGSNSEIPLTDGFVLSGHGKARDWLIANAPLGAKIQIDPDNKGIHAIIDADTYTYQLTQRLQTTAPLLKPAIRKEMEAIQQKITRLQEEDKPEEATRLSTEALETLNRAIWKESPAFPASAIRAAWHRPVETNRIEIGRTLDTLRRGGLNTVFLETFFHGYTIFPSQTYKEYGLEEQNPKFVGTDILKLWVEEAHRRDMKVHIWFQDFYVGTKAFKAPGPILSKYPEWANIQYSALDLDNPDKVVLTPSTLETGGYFLDPANNEAQVFLLKLINEIVTNYDVDGFQLDYIRYPASFPPDRFSYLKTTWGYTPIARALFKDASGVDPITLTPAQTELWAEWNQFKAKQVTHFVEQASKTIHNSKPGVQVSAAVFPRLEDSMLLKHQDWGTWAQQGWVDFLAPMTLTSSVKVVEEDLAKVVSRTGTKTPVIAGVFGPFNANSAENLLEQIEAAKKSGSTGYSIFDSAHLTGRMIQALNASQSDNTKEH